MGELSKRTLMRGKREEPSGGETGRRQRTDRHWTRRESGGEKRG